MRKSTNSTKSAVALCGCSFGRIVVNMLHHEWQGTVYDALKYISCAAYGHAGQTLITRMKIENVVESCDITLEWVGQVAKSTLNVGY